MKKQKKGFTVVELVIVIAVIAILAAVLIPTFSGLINSARKSKTEQLVRNVNTALSMDVGDDHATAYSAFAAAKKRGYDIELINKSQTDNPILYDSNHKLFCYYDKDANEYYYVPDFEPQENAKPQDYFAITNSQNAQDFKGHGWSVYASSDWADGENVTLNGVGFDAGDFTGITSVTYNGSSNGQTAIIRTCSYDTLVTVDAEKDTVIHFDKAKEVNVKAVNLYDCYRERGDVLGNINLEQGKVVLEDGCKASAVVIDMTATELATVTTLSADNTKANYVPIILKTTKESWASNAHKELIDPSKNNIIYTIPGASSTVLNDDGQTVTGEEVANASAYNKTKNVYYMTVDKAINSAGENETVIILKDNELYHKLPSEVNPIAKGVTIDLNGNLMRWEKDAWVTGENLTVKNGKLTGTTDAQSYSCFFGDEDPTSVKLLNLDCVGGFNFYNTTATLTACDVRLNTGYNVIWADDNSMITVESGTYDATLRSVGKGVVGCSNSLIMIKGGTFVSNDTEIFCSSSEYNDEYKTETKGIFVSGGNFNVNVSDFTFTIVKNNQIIESREHVSVVMDGYKCTKVGDKWVVSSK